MKDWRTARLPRHGFKSCRFDSVYIDERGDITGDNPDQDLYCYEDAKILSDCIDAWFNKDAEQSCIRLVEEYGTRFHHEFYKDADCTIPSNTDPMNTVNIIRYKISEIYLAYKEILASNGTYFLDNNRVSFKCCTDSRYGFFSEVDDWIAAAYFELFQLAALDCFAYDNPKVKLICKSCGKEFEARHKQKKYCAECSTYAAQKRRQRAKEASQHEAGKQ